MVSLRLFLSIQVSAILILVIETKQGPGPYPRDILIFFHFFQKFQDPGQRSSQSRFEFFVFFYKWKDGHQFIKMVILSTVIDYTAVF